MISMPIDEDFLVLSLDLLKEKGDVRETLPGKVLVFGEKFNDKVSSVAREHPNDH
jgi:hypothetical protein